ncbi:phage tail tape measure C-terminal domain-containing protein [Maricaulis sp. CAU 1757]
MAEFDDDIEAAGAALEALADGPARRAADAMEAAFARTGDNIEQAFERAARSGELSFNRLTEAVLRDLARLAGEQVLVRPLQGLMERALGGLDFAGAKAEGGPVTAGGAYLVGERGPELFVPAQAGALQAPPGGVNVHVHLGEAGTAEPELSRARLGRALVKAIDKARRWS